MKVQDVSQSRRMYTGNKSKPVITIKCEINNTVSKVHFSTTSEMNPTWLLVALSKLKAIEPVVKVVSNMPARDEDPSMLVTPIGCAADCPPALMLNKAFGA